MAHEADGCDVSMHESCDDGRQNLIVRQPYTGLFETSKAIYGNAHAQSFVGGIGAVFIMLPASRNSTISLFPSTSFTTANAPFV
jgi:hypothetical protein